VVSAIGECRRIRTQPTRGRLRFANQSWRKRSRLVGRLPGDYALLEGLIDRDAFPCSRRDTTMTVVLNIVLSGAPAIASLPWSGGVDHALLAWRRAASPTSCRAPRPEKPPMTIIHHPADQLPSLRIRA